MGKERLVDKTNKPVHPLSVPTTLSPLHVTNRASSDLGVLPIGVFKGQAAFWDLDKAVNLPLAWIEQQHILGILDGREEDYDLATLTPAVGAATGTVYRKTLTVPSGVVWYINAVEVVLNTTAAAHSLLANWRCSLWTDRADPPSEYGQAFYYADLTHAATTAAATTLAEFGPIATAWLITNKTVLLRLPAGAKITFVVTTGTAAVNEAVANTLRLKGFTTRALVA